MHSHDIYIETDHTSRTFIWVSWFLLPFSTHMHCFTHYVVPTYEKLALSLGLILMEITHIGLSSMEPK